jgi:amino acid adenylation domain-containing protein
MEMNTEIRERIAALSPRQRELLAQRLGQKENGTEKADLAIPRRSPGRPPLSFAQQRLWFLDQLEPGSALYNIPLAALIPAPLDAVLFERSLNMIVARHESLRTTFAMSDSGPVQVIHDELWIPLEVHDLTDIPANEVQSVAEEMVAAHGRVPLDLETGPLMKIGLLRLGPREHIFMASMHHIIADTASIGIVLAELSAIYAALTHGQQPPLPELPIQYADYAQWQRDWLQGDVLQRQLEYWRGQLSGDLPMLDLPVDRPRPAQPSFRGAQLVHRLSSEASLSVNALAAQEKVPPFAALLTSLAVLLHRYSAQDKVSIGSPISNRARPELQSMVGYLANTVLLRVDLGGEPTFREAVRRAHEVNIGAQSNQDLPFDKIVEIAQPERDLSGTPLLQVMFVFRSENVSDLATNSGLPAVDRELSTGNGTSKFDLTFSLEATAEGYRLEIEYATDLFDEDTIRRMAGHWESLVTSAVAAPDTPVGMLPLLTGAERQQLVLDWNDTATEYPADRCLHELIESQADRRPEAVAVSSRHEQLTYAQLDERANQLAHHLMDLGAGPDVPVAISMEKSPELVVGLLAILKAGSAYLPLDPAYPAERLAYMLSDAAAPVLLTQAHLQDGLPTSDAVHIVSIDTDQADIAARSTERPRSGVTAENLAYVIYTSGSTGRPKGVLLNHRGRVNNFHDFNQRFAISSDDCLLGVASSSFDMSAYDVFGTLMAGARLSLPDPGSERDPFNWLETGLRDRVTVWHSVPALLEMFVELCEAEPRPEVPALRLALLGGDWIPLTLPDRIRALAPATDVISLGGATEVSMDSTIYPVGEVDTTWRSIPYGKPMANQHCFVLDRNLQPVPVGVPGDLYLGGVGVGRGYHNDPELTARRFVDNPLPEWPNARIYRTGDRARYRPDGNLELLGRSDFQVKLRGWRIELSEVEAALRAQPGVKEAVAVVAGEKAAHRRLVGYLVAEKDVQMDLTATKENLRSTLPQHFVPATLVQLTALPLTANGKIDRRQLPAVDLSTDQDTSSYVAPRSRTERTLAGVWRETLGAEKVGINANFFELGGDSIMAIQVITRARRLGLRLSPKQLFQHQTIAKLAAVAEDAEIDGSAESPTMLSVPSEAEREQLLAAYPDMVDAYPLTPVQRHMLRRELSDPHPGQYVIQADYLFIAGAMDVDAITRAWQQIIARHPVLRSSFVWEGFQGPVQVVHEDAPVEVQQHDWVAFSESEQLRLQDELVAADRARGFDLAQAPLLRVHLMEIAPGMFKYMSTNHHILLDGWSRAIVQQEVFAVYEGLLTGQEVSLPPQRSFRDYIAWLRGQEQHEAEYFWQDYLKGFTSPTPLVRSRGLPDPVKGMEFAKQRVPLPADTATAAREFCRRHQLTLNTVIEGAWLLLLSRYTGRDDVVLGVTSSGRSTDFDGVDTVAGLCMNVLPVRVRIEPDEPALSWLSALQSHQVDLRQYESTAVEEVLGREMVEIFECQMVFENFPWDGSLNKLGDRLDFSHPMARADYQKAQFEFPLRVEVAPSPVHHLMIMHYYPGIFAHETVTEMISDWQWAIGQLVSDPDQTLAAVVNGAIDSS